MKQLEYLSAAEIGREVNAGHISPTEVVRYFEQRIADGNGDLNAFVYTKFEEAALLYKQFESVSTDTRFILHSGKAML